MQQRAPKHMKPKLAELKGEIDKLNDDSLCLKYFFEI